MAFRAVTDGYPAIKFDVCGADRAGIPYPGSNACTVEVIGRHVTKQVCCCRYGGIDIRCDVVLRSGLVDGHQFEPRTVPRAASDGPSLGQRHRLGGLLRRHGTRLQRVYRVCTPGFRLQIERDGAVQRFTRSHCRCQFLVQILVLSGGVRRQPHTNGQGTPHDRMKKKEPLHH